eukprot:725012-Rhodomonas_salina.1
MDVGESVEKVMDVEEVMEIGESGERGDFVGARVEVEKVIHVGDGGKRGRRGCGAREGVEEVMGDKGGGEGSTELQLKEESTRRR